MLGKIDIFLFYFVGIIRDHLVAQNSWVYVVLLEMTAAPLGCLTRTIFLFGLTAFCQTNICISSYRILYVPWVSPAPHLCKYQQHVRACTGWQTSCQTLGLRYWIPDNEPEHFAHARWRSNTSLPMPWIREKENNSCCTNSNSKTNPRTPFHSHNLSSLTGNRPEKIRSSEFWPKSSTLVE